MLIFDQSKFVSRNDESALGKHWPRSQKKAAFAFNSNFQTAHATHASSRPTPKLRIFSVSYKNFSKILIKFLVFVQSLDSSPGDYHLSTVFPVRKIERPNPGSSITISQGRLLRSLLLFIKLVIVAIGIITNSKFY